MGTPPKAFQCGMKVKDAVLVHKVLGAGSGTGKNGGKYFVRTVPCWQTGGAGMNNFEIRSAFDLNRLVQSYGLQPFRGQVKGNDLYLFVGDIAPSR